MKLFCAAEGCNLSSDKSKMLHKYTGMKDVTVHNFSNEQERKRKRGTLWLDMGKRKYFDRLLRKVVFSAFLSD